MALIGRDVKMFGSSSSLSENKPDELTLPTEDFLASIGLQPRNSEDGQCHKSAMPAGWRRVLVQRKVGRTAGKFDVYIYSPEGRKFRSKTELEAHIKKFNLNVNISDFCFTVRGQHLLDLAANHDGKGRSYKRKHNSSQEAPIDGRLENTSSSDADDLPPKRKRMRLWERPSANSAVLPVSSDTAVVATAKTESKKPDRWNQFLDSHVQLVKEASVRKDKGLLAKHISKSPNTKPRRTSQKLTVRMKFMPTFVRNLTDDSVDNKSSSQQQIAAYLCSDVNNTDMLTSNGEVSPTVSACKLVTKQNGPRGKKQQPEQFSSIKPPTSPAKSPTANRRQNSSPQQNVAKGNESSADIRWIPPQSPFNLVEESLFHSSWKILVASIILEHGQDDVQRKALFTFLRRWPSVESALGATWQQVHRLLQPYDVTQDTAKTLLRFCEEYLTKSWCYPRELHGIKKYGDDAYRIFCINEWKQVAPDNPKLNEYHRWLWNNHRILGIQ